jgi:hypothetical protein
MRIGKQARKSGSLLSLHLCENPGLEVRLEDQEDPYEYI